MAYALGAFAVACVCIRHNICEINLVKTESVQSAYEFVYNIKEKQVKKNIIKQNPRAVRLRRSEIFIPFSLVVVVAAAFFLFYSFSAFIAFSSWSFVCGALAAGFTARNHIDFSFCAADVYGQERMKKTNKRQRGCSTVHTAYCVACGKENEARRMK